MIFELTLYDRKGNQLQEGDIVKISNDEHFTFFAEVKYIESEQIITPFHTFSFHSFEKVDKLPDGVEDSTETRYKIWWLPDKDRKRDKQAKDFERYLISWRECEDHLQKRCWRIKKKSTQPTLF